MKKLLLYSITGLFTAFLFSGYAAAHSSMMHDNYSFFGPQQKFQGPVDEKAAEKILKDYVEDMGNINLKAGAITDHNTVFLGEILTQEGSLVNQVEIDKATGRVYNQHAMAPGMRDWRYCPYCGSDFGGTGYRPGMRGPGYGHHSTFHPFQKPDIPMNAKEAKDLVRDYLSSIRNPNLKIGNVNEKSAAFEIEIVTKKTEDLVDIIAVNKNTGNLRSTY